MTIQLNTALLALSLILIACDEGSDVETTAGEMTAGEMTAGALEIVGSYMDDYMTEHVITEERWTQTYMGDVPSLFHIDKVNSEEKYLIAQNDEANVYSPSLWSRIDWTFSSDELYICQGVFDAESAEAAEAAEAPNSEDPANGGCGMFPWSKLNAQ